MRHSRILLFCALGVALITTAVSANPGASWRSWGRDHGNTRFQFEENIVSPQNVANLGVKWIAEVSGSVSATPAVEDNAVYVPDFGGALSRIDRATGAVVWSRTLASYTGIPGLISRTTPAIAGNLLILGDQGGRVGAGARVIAVDKNTGDLAWVTQLSQHPAALITQSGSVFGNRFFVGVSSAEETYTVAVPGYVCCTFRGSMAALDVNTGAVVWQTPMIDDAAYAKGYRGNAVWGSAPAIDPSRNSVYIATGNNYDIPASVGACVQVVLQTTPDDEDAVRACLAGDVNYFDTILALDMTTGDVKWANTVLPFDAFTVACVFLPEIFGDNCPSPEGPDHDFGQAPMIFRTTIDGVSRQLIGAGQKSGVFWALDPDDGSVVWNTKVGPGGPVGGAMWGSATDGERLYVTEANHRKEPWVLQGSGASAGQSVDDGFWSALDPATGAILWQTPDPTGGPRLTGPPSAANGVVYAGGLVAPTSPNMFALDGATGDILWSFSSEGSVNSGPAIVDGTLYWGSGYVGVGTGNVPSTKVYAFELQ